MTTANSTNFQAYLESICSNEKYLGWQDFYTPTDALHRQRIEKKQPPRGLNLSLMVQTIPPPEEKAEKEKVERLEVLAGLRKYADNHLLLVGKPGSGKSTALERLLWEEAEKARQKQTPPPNPLPDDGEGGQDGKGGQKIPVLVELRLYKTSVLGIIGDFLFQHRCRLNEAEIEQLLLAGRFLLLVDGWNELPNEEARKDVKKFREKYQRFTPMIFTTRELAGDIGIEKKLEMQPLTEEQMRQFVVTNLPEERERLLQQLQGRLRELGETPLLLWMICELFKITGNIPPNLGLVFRCFAQSYDSQIKQDASTDESRSRWFFLLQHLAFEMMWGKAATDLRVTIPKQETEDIMTRFLTANQFDKPRECSFNWLNDLLKYHLIQLTNSNREIEFHHQLLQEYYAAEKLLVQLPQLSDDRLKRDYLNYLKWTEPLALMLALVDDEKQALRVVKLALEVDLRLGARLAGEIKQEFQEKSVDLVVKLKIPQDLRVEFLGLTRSVNAVAALINALNDENSFVRSSAAGALGDIGNSQAVDALILALNDENSDVRKSAASALGNIGNSELLPRLTTYLTKNNELDVLSAITGIQNRCKYYNYEIYTSLAPEKQKPKNPIIDTLNTIKETFNTMSETPKVQMNFHDKVYGAAGNVEGDQIVNAPKQNLAESAAEIQQLLEQLAKNNQTIVQSDNQAVVVSAIHEEIKLNPTIKARLWNALKAGGTEALKLALDAIFKNPAVSISVETIKGYIEAE